MHQAYLTPRPICTNCAATATHSDTFLTINGRKTSMPLCTACAGALIALGRGSSIREVIG